MNQRVFIYILFLICVSLMLGCKDKGKLVHDKKFVLNGKFLANYNDSIFITYGGIKDCTLVNNNTFSFKGKVDGVDKCEAFLQLKSGGNLGVVFLDTDTINTLIDYKIKKQDNVNYNYLFVKEVKGSNNHTLWLDWVAFWKQNSSMTNFYEIAGDKLEKSIESFPESPINGRILYLYANEGFDLATTTRLKSLIDTTAFFSNDLLNVNSLIRSKKHIQRGASFKKFILENQIGQKENLPNLKKKYLLIDFWASWCGPCREENTKLVELESRYREKLEIISISLDDSRKDWKVAIKKDNIYWENYIDIDGFNSEIAKYYGITALPFNILIDPSGKIVEVNVKTNSIPSLIK